MPSLSVFDFVLKGKVPVVCHSFLSTWEEVCSLYVGFYGVWVTTVVSISNRHSYDGVVVLTNVLYIFLLVLILTLEGACSVLQGMKGDDVYAGMLKHVFESFQKKRQFYQGLSSK